MNRYRADGRPGAGCSAIGIPPAGKSRPCRAAAGNRRDHRSGSGAAVRAPPRTAARRRPTLRPEAGEREATLHLLKEGAAPSTIARGRPGVASPQWPNSRSIAGKSTFSLRRSRSCCSPLTSFFSLTGRIFTATLDWCTRAIDWLPVPSIYVCKHGQKLEL